MAGAGIVLGFLSIMFALLVDIFRVVVLVFMADKPGLVERGNFHLAVRFLNIFGTFWLFIAVVTAGSVLPNIKR